MVKTTAESPIVVANPRGMESQADPPSMKAFTQETGSDAMALYHNPISNAPARTQSGKVPLPVGLVVVCVAPGQRAFS